MPRLIFDILNRPLRGPSLVQCREGLSWLLAGLRMAVPRAFRELGWTQVAELVVFKDNTTIESHGVIERALFGDARLVNKKPSKRTLPIIVEIHTDLVYETALELPAAASGQAAQAVSLRLDDISPIPPKEAVIAIGRVRTTSGHRAAVDIAITRKSGLDLIRKSIHDRTIQCIGAIRRQNGTPKYRFDEMGWQATGAAYWIGALIFVWVSILLLGLSLNLRNDWKMVALNEYEETLLTEIKSTQTRRREYVRLEKATPPLVYAASALEAIQNGLADLPSKTVITRIAVEGRIVSIAGLAPEGSMADPYVRQTQANALDYPRYEAFLIKATGRPNENDGGTE